MCKKVHIYPIYRIDVYNIDHETIYSASQHIHLCKRLIQDFGVTLLYFKGEANIVSNTLIRLPMVYHTNKLADKTLEEDTCELLCPDLLLIYDNTDCFSLNIEEI